MFDPQQPLRDLMATELVCVGPDDTLAKAEHHFESAGIRHLPVCTPEREVVGMFSYHDYTRMMHNLTVFGTAESKRVNKQTMNSLLVSEVVSDKVYTIESTATIQDAANIFLRSNFHSLPVVEPGTQRIVGIITVMDLMHYAYGRDRD
jgi:CBS domain-containing protein